MKKPDPVSTEDHIGIDRNIPHHIGLRRRKCALEELLAGCDSGALLPKLPGWDEMVPVGIEILDRTS